MFGPIRQCRVVKKQPPRPDPSFAFFSFPIYMISMHVTCTILKPVPLETAWLFMASYKEVLVRRTVFRFCHGVHSVACRNVRTPGFGALGILFISIDLDVLSNVGCLCRYVFVANIGPEIGQLYWNSLSVFRLIKRVIIVSGGQETLSLWPDPSFMFFSFPSL